MIFENRVIKLCDKSHVIKMSHDLTVRVTNVSHDSILSVKKTVNR